MAFDVSKWLKRTMRASKRVARAAGGEVRSQRTLPMASWSAALPSAGSVRLSVRTSPAKASEAVIRLLPLPLLSSLRKMSAKGEKR